MNRLFTLGVAVSLLTACAGGGTTSPIPPSAGSNTAQSSIADFTAPQNSPDSTPSATTQATTGSGGFADGSAYAAQAQVDVPTAPAQVLSGPIAPAQLGCNVGTRSAYNSVATLNAHGLATSSGTAADSVQSTSASAGGSVTSASTVQGVNVLGGLIRANIVKAQANSSSTSSSATSNESGSQLTGLVVAGVPITVQPAPNTKIALANLGYVVLNEVYGETNNAVSSNGTRSTAINVNMIHVVVTTTNALKIAIGTNIIVASAHSSFTVPPAPFAENATAYSLYALGVAGNINASSGPWAPASIGCHYSSDEKRLASASTPVGALGTMVNDAAASIASSSTSANATSNTASVTLLGGLISAQALVAKAGVTRSGSSYAVTASLTFTHLAVGGTNIAINVAPNTRVSIRGVGYAIVNERSGSIGTGGATEEENAVHLHVTLLNSYNLPIGASIVVGHAHAAVTPI